MIKAVMMMMNTQGKPRLAKFYDFLTVENTAMLRHSYPSHVSTRAHPRRIFSRPENVSNFLEIDSLFGPDFLGLYTNTMLLSTLCLFLMDQRMSFAVLDLIHVLVEILDKCFSNVCELFNYSKMHTVLDEIVFGGQVLETSSTEVIKAVENISKLEAASNAISLVPKSVSGWRRR